MEKRNKMILNITLKIFLLMAMSYGVVALKQHRKHSDAVVTVDVSPVPVGDVQITYHPQAPLEPDTTMTAEDLMVEVSCGQTIDVISTIHASVGSSFDVVCDTTFFDVTEYVRYHHPESMSQITCGGDRATKTVKLTAKQCGSSTVRCIEGWRGSVANEVEYTIVVK